MPTKANAKRPDQYVGKQVRIARESKRWKQSELVTRLEELGFTHWRQSKIAKIENGETKRLALEDAIALAVALGVQLPHLLAPDGLDVELAPKLRCSSVEFRQWTRGYRPLRPEDEKTYYAGALVPDDEWRQHRASLAGFESMLKDPTALEQLQAQLATLERRGG